MTDSEGDANRMELVTRLRAIEKTVSDFYTTAAQSASARAVAAEFGRDRELLELFALSQEYLEAAAELDKLSRGPGPSMWSVWTQLAGHAVELALKACLWEEPGEYKPTHNLVRLMELALRRGVTISNEGALYTVVHLNHLFGEEYGTQRKLPARYGAQSAATFPHHLEVDGLVRGLLDEAERLAPRM
jgi:hypothetical protein